MRGDFLHVKANFMIFITIFSIFAIYFASPAAAETASTQETNSQGTASTQEPLGCCADAKNTGEHCVMTTESECESAATGFTPASCEQTSYCKPGCCVSLDGVCSSQVAKGTCQALEGYAWQDNANCEIPQCQKGCCVLGGAQCFYTTDRKCNQVTSEYEALTPDFRTAVGTEYDCLNVCKQQDEGCCVSEEGKCTFTARASCPTRESDPSSGVGFSKDTFCSNENIECKCEPHAKQDCLEGKEDVYWFDSCGNREEIATEIIEGSQNNAQNGDCDYSTGTLCGHDKNGKAICKDLNCAETYTDPKVTYDFQGKPRSNGESWCMYDAKPGVGSDPVGSRHFRHMCINGEEQVASCVDARQEMCLQGLIENVPFKESGDVIEAQCVPNDDKPCITTCNTAMGLDNADESRLKDAMKKDRTCCKREVGKCVWMDWDKDNDLGRCYPIVSPGDKFWSGKTSSIQREPECDQASMQYTTVWQESVVWRGDYKCKQGCEVYTDDYLNLVNNYCNSIGDCGAQYNTQGIWTSEGLYRTWDKEEDNKVKMNDKEYTAAHTADKDPYDSWNTNANPPGRLNIDKGIVSYSIDAKSLPQSDGLASNKAPAVTGGLMGAAVVISYLTSSGFAFAGSVGSVGAIGGVASAGYIAAAGGYVIAALGVVIFAYGAWKGDRNTMIIGAAAISIGAAVLTIAAATCTAACWSGYGAIVAAVVAILAWIALATARDEKRTVTIQCSSWQPPVSGYDCKSCDSDPMKSCSEYRCKSIGQNCAFISENEGTNRGTCYNANPDDVNSPRIIDKSAVIISHKEDISSNFQLVPTETSTQVTGFKITPNVPPYSKVTIAIKTNELSQCKIGQELPQGAAPYGVLPNYMPDSYYDMQHNYTIAGVIPEKEYHYYAACQDPSGNSQATVYGVSFTVDQGNDLTPPQITGATLKNNAYVAAGINETLLAIYVDEQSRLECKWSKEDKDFNFMENNMSCISVPLEAMNSRPAECGANMQLYAKNSKYYFRCKDYPMEYAGGAPTGNVLSSNVMQQSFSLSLQKSDALIIQQTAPSGRLYTNNVTMQVKTQQGAETGKAACYYNDIMFASTNNSYHEQNLANLPTNDYKYKIECQDIAGNIAESNISFSIDVDTVAPSIIGIHKSGNDLKIITDEPTKCQYSNSSFSYGMGTAMPPDNSAEHSVSATMPKYYITCADAFNNRMPEVKIVLFESIS